MFFWNNFCETWDYVGFKTRYFVKKLSDNGDLLKETEEESMGMSEKLVCSM